MAKTFKNTAIHMNKRKKARLPLSALLSYLLIATLILSSVSLARYTATSTDGDSAKIASFNVSAVKLDGQPDILSISPVDGTTGEYQFYVNNDSEVSVTYSVIINNMPDNVTVEMTVGEDSTPAVFQQTEDNTLATTASELEINDKMLCTLTFTALEGAEGTHDVSLQVLFEQID